MNTPPHIEPVNPEDITHSTRLRPILQRAGTRPVSAFTVTRPGVFRGRHYSVGEVLLCGGTPTPRSTVVLVARGLGRPRLGSVQGGRLLGDRGETCSEVRWQPVGRVLAVLRHVEVKHPDRAALAALPPDAWVVVSTLTHDQHDEPASRPQPRQTTRAARQRPPTRPMDPQLSLFRWVS